jgi:molybdopterin synthase sulfur carrier subunit
MKVLFFARLREALGQESIVAPADMNGASVRELKRWILAQHPGELSDALSDPNIFCAVNQRVVDDDYRLSPEDEVAFFPPVTGG